MGTESLCVHDADAGERLSRRQVNQARVYGVEGGRPPERATLLYHTIQSNSLSIQKKRKEIRDGIIYTPRKDPFFPLLLFIYIKKGIQSKNHSRSVRSSSFVPYVCPIIEDDQEDHRQSQQYQISSFLKLSSIDKQHLETDPTDVQEDDVFLQKIMMDHI